MQDLAGLLSQLEYPIGKVVDFDPKKDRIVELDLSIGNTDLNQENLSSTFLLGDYINKKLKQKQARFGIGGYLEHRNIYSRSAVFDSDEEPRRLHLGVDIWGAYNTQVYCPVDAVIHSFAFNNNYGDYGATIILEHRINGHLFYSLYGHLCKKNIENIKIGDKIKAGSAFANFGNALENGDWPPHLHFQLIWDMEGKMGDYYGVAKVSEKHKFESLCPNPMLILQHTF